MYSEEDLHTMTHWGYGPTMLETLLFTPPTAHNTFPPPRVVQLGFPTVVCPSRAKPPHPPLNSSTESALSVMPNTPHTICLAATSAQLPLDPTKQPIHPHPVQADAPHAPP